ncbi:PD-(D/E)XK nuclease family protein [Emticicia sp. BO119]|uniref:PD-(D/E)XK nuclease family protein n=1 Tax=Emticicia sp. BO119 TaxID=2757768 RepID=UPI0015EFDCCD|nr:PD-(D/E)XK nuclease family protein [Emticicia sp. BO119]MBA4853336.1 PD-(D/E)XK nuclease family protein [Emticicia sp. BO119]
MVFLEQSAHYVFGKHPLAQLKNICVILPNRRAVYYFKRYLARVSKVPFLSPQVFAIDDFVAKMSGFNQIDAVGLLFELYETFRKYDPDVDFDRFISWAPTLLRDFDMIDQYLIGDPKALFDYISEAQTIARWNLELTSVNKPLLESTSNTERYFKLFENIYNVYNDLHNELRIKGFSYRGMSYRLLAEEVDTLLLENHLFERFYFIGFNAFSKSEEKVIEKLVKANLAEMLWDCDDYFMNPRFNNKAGNLLRRYKASGKFGSWNWQSSHLLTEEKNIRIIGVENATLQTKVAGNIYAEILAENPAIPTAIVLCDENLLYPLMYSLDSIVSDFNITMGLSLKGSMLFTLIDAIFELQQNIVEFKDKTGKMVKVPKYSHRHIFKVLNHPFCRKYEQMNFVNEENGSELNIFRETFLRIIQGNIVYLSEEEIIGLGNSNKLFKILFTRWGDNPQKALKSFYDLIDELRSVYRESKDAIETEYLYLFLTILNRLEKILFSNRQINLKSFKHFLYELIKQEKIPFSGEPIANLQIMGMLETRCLDFEKVIFLSVNEGVLPSTRHLNSLIPFDASIEFGLPVQSDQNAIMSYHFFRLLQRAKEIDILYVIPSGEGVSGGATEKSRFILQIENELAKENQKIKISYPRIEYAKIINKEVISRIEIRKTPDILLNISQLISGKGIYPTYLNEYLHCTMKFYFNKVANISKREEVDENFGADIFGTWLHNTLEKIDIDHGPMITKELIDLIVTEIPKRLETAYLEQFGGYVIDSGMNFLLKQVAEQLLEDFFKQQKESQVFPYQVLETEREVKVIFDMDVLGKVQKVKIAGRVDRIEKEGNTIKVIDYKTGRVGKKELEKPREQILEEALVDPDKDKLRQLWLYQYLMLKSIAQDKSFLLGGERLENHDVKAKIYSFRNMKENLEVNLSFNDNPTIFGFIEKSEEILANLIKEMLNPDIPFIQTNNQLICERCDFKGICGR